MSSASVFLIAAVLLLLLVLAILLPPLWRKPKASPVIDRPAANLAILRQQLAELERDRDDGTLAAADFAPAKAELQRRLLEEVPSDALPLAGKPGGRKTAFGLLFVLPLAAIIGYILLGAPRALAPVAAPAAAHMDSAQIDAMLQKLADRLQVTPDDHKGWIILARSYKTLGRFADAADAYSHGGDLLDQDAVLLADYAEALAQANGGSFTGKPEELLTRALALDANEPQALFLAGAAANERREFAAVVDYWSRLLVQLEPGSEEAASLGEAVNTAREVLARGGSSNKPNVSNTPITPITPNVPTASTAPTPPTPPTIPPASAALSTRGEVSISPALAAQAKPDDVLFIFARADEGSRMPLAVLRRRVADLPLTFQLDDSMGLPGGQKLSAAQSVTIEARVAKAGMAQSAPGDLYGLAKGIKPGSDGLQILINQVQE